MLSLTCLWVVACLARSSLGYISVDVGEGGDGTLADLNTIFRSKYDATKLAALDSLPLVLIMLNEQVTLMQYGEQVANYSVNMNVYNDLKACAHASIGFFSVCHLTHIGQPLPNTLQQFATDLNLLANLASGSSNMNETHKTQCSALIELYMATFSAAFSGEYDHDMCLKGLRQSQNMLLGMVETAGQIHFEEYKLTLDTIKNDIMNTTDGAWDEAVVVIMDSQNARLDNLLVGIAMDYFGHDMLYNNRLYYAENIRDINTAVLFLMQKLADSSVSAAVFEQKYHEGRDLFAEVATKHIGYSYFPGVTDELCNITGGGGEASEGNTGVATVAG